MNLLTGSRLYLTAVVRDAGEVIQVPRNQLRRLVSEDEELSNLILRAYLAPRSILIEIGKVWSVRRPLVYRAIETLTEIGFIEPTGMVASQSGPPRTVVRASPAGRRALAKWLVEPVAHVRDARSLLMLKLLFLGRRSDHPRPLRAIQRESFMVQAERLGAAAAEAEGFDEVLIRWRLESTTAAVRFIESLIARPS